MESSNRRITFKVLIGYIILGILAAIAGYLILSQIKTLTQFQNRDISDRSKVIKTGSLIADIYENESLARAAIQLNSTEKFDEYVLENEKLLNKIDSLNIIVENGYQELILDSIKLVIDKKLQNVTDLKELKLNDNSEESINKAIDKLSSIDAILGKLSVRDFVENPNSLDRNTRKSLEEYVSLINKYNPQDSVNTISQKQIDSLVSVSKSTLLQLQRETSNQRKSLFEKERELIENDLMTSRKLRELLSTLETDIILYSNNINEQREVTLNRSKRILLFAAGISFIIIIVFSIIILNDFWKSQKYRNQLEEANETTSSLLKSREQLISMVSHDLRTPLSTITGYSELLQKSTHNTKDSNYIEHIKSASSYMGQLVEDLLEFSKLEGGKITIESVPFNLRKNIDEIALNAENLFKDDSIKLVVKHDNNIDHPIISDPFRIKQILYNLIVNAYKFTKKGSITVESFLTHTSSGKKILEISVSDTGIGISKHEQSTIFKAFTQADNSKESKHSGFGLGLTISKKLSELLGGQLMLKSKLHEGSTFTLKIPVTLSDKPLEMEKTVEDHAIFNIQALVVEDDASLRQLMTDLLKQHAIDIHAFDNAQSALDVINQIHFDVVFTDIQLPKMNGIHFMETLKNHEVYQGQPIIAMTGRANMSVEDYLESGFSEVLIKPFHPNRLQEVLNHFFDATSISVEKKPMQESENDVPKGFSVTSLGSFLNHDIAAIKNTLKIFLEDTQLNFSELKEAFDSHDMQTVNSLSHKMLSMFKQLDVKNIVPYLEKFETADNIPTDTFESFNKEMNTFLEALEEYIY